MSIINKEYILTPNIIMKIPEEKQNEMVNEYIKLYKNIISTNNIDSFFKSNIIIYYYEFFNLFYHSLKIIKNHYISNSQIISIGESPYKLVFSQELFYNNEITKSLLYKNNYPTDLSFLSLPLSNIGKTFNKNKENFSCLYIEYVCRYFTILKIDPSSIIESKKDKYIFIDRAEAFNSCYNFIFIYSKLCEYQKVDKIMFINKFKFIGFDCNYDDEAVSLVKIKRIHILLKEDFNVKNEDIGNYFVYYLFDLYFDLILSNEKNNKKYNEHVISTFNKIHNNFNININHKLINFITLPEIMKLYTRCVNKFEITSKLSDDDLMKINQTQSEQNCNIILVTIYKIFNDMLKNNIMLIGSKMTLIDIINNYTYFEDNIKNIYDSDIKNIINIINLNNDKVDIINISNNLLYTYKILELNKIDNIKNVLYLNFDETLGSFHICYSTISLILEYYLINKILTIKQVNDIRKEYLIIHIRPFLKEFFHFLKSMKDNKYIDTIIILSSNSDNNYFKGYFNNTITLIQEIVECNIIDDIITGKQHKLLFTNSEDQKKFILYNKCQKIIPKNNCIHIDPYIVYVNYDYYLKIMTKNQINQVIIDNIRNKLIELKKTDFNISDKNSYINQYIHIKNMKERYEIKNDEDFKKYDDDKLLKSIEIIKEKFITNPDISILKKYLKYKNKYLEFKKNMIINR